MRKAFTMVELIVVMVIIGMVAVFAIPNFTKTINRSKARDAVLNLNVIHASNILYRTRNGGNLNEANLAAINTELGLNIIANGATYACDGTDCVATGTGFVLTVDLDAVLSDTNPSCNGGASCP
jgi:prepilin-type N-terminal cleavage/methylation domain-containing protein